MDDRTFTKIIYKMEVDGTRGRSTLKRKGTEGLRELVKQNGLSSHKNERLGRRRSHWKGICMGRDKVLGM